MRQLPLADRGLPPFPSGWFAVAFSSEVRVGDVLSRTFMGRDIVLFRGRDGRVRALDAYCPHMGAHLGHGGTVENNTVRCPFHGFCFDGDGECTSTGYNTRPPSKARVRAWHLREFGGALFLWHHPASITPNWEPPTIDESGFTRVREALFQLPGHPQETSENSVDIGHLSIVHGYTDIELHDTQIDGPLLHTRVSFTRPRGLLPFGSWGSVRTHARIYVHGLGLSYVDTEVPMLGLQTRQFVFSSVTQPGQIDLRLGMQVRMRPDAPSWIRRLTHPMLDHLLMPIVMHSYKADVKQDFAIWKNKRYVHPPVLAEGDGPIVRYRSWARQFYTDTPHEEAAQRTG